MIKIKRNRLKIFESLAPDCELNLTEENNQIKGPQKFLKANKHCCILDEKLFEIGSNSLVILLPFLLSEETAYSICRYYGDISYFKINVIDTENKKYSSVLVNYYDIRSAVFAYQEIDSNTDECSDFSIKFSDEKKEYYEKFFLKIALSREDIPKEKLKTFLYMNSEIYRISQQKNDLIIHLFSSKDYYKLSFILEKVALNFIKVNCNPKDFKDYKHLFTMTPKFFLENAILKKTGNPLEKIEDKSVIENDKISCSESISTTGSNQSLKEYVIVYDQEYSGIRKRNTPDIEKQKYVISVEKIINNVDLRTTLMVKNIPNTISQIELLEQVNLKHRGCFNFFYLPIDFKTKLNVGYAFINFKEPSKIVNFFLEFNCKKWSIGNVKRDKVCFLSYARIQGLRCILDHFKRSSIMKQIDEKLKPMVFN